MLSGVVDTENLPQVLRDISQKRKQGVLEIRNMHRKVLVHFVLGKIVDVSNDGTPPHRDLVDRLVSAGVVPDNLSLEAAVGYRDLLSRLKKSPDGQFLNEELFTLALRHLILDKVYDLGAIGSASYQFRAQMVEGDRDLLPSLSVGQILLDMVSLVSDKPKLESLIPTDSLLYRGTSDPDQTLSEEEQIVFELAREGLNREEIARRSMLSRYHVQDALISLIEHRIIKVVDPKSAASTQEIDHESLAKDPEIEVDEAVRETPEQSRADSGVDGETSLSTEESISRVESHFSFKRMNSLLLHSDLVPTVVFYLFLAAAVTIPLFMWRDVILRFK